MTWAQSAPFRAAASSPAAPPGQEWGHGAGDGQRDAEGDGAHRQDDPDHHEPEYRRSEGDGQGQEGAQVQVRERVDVVDGPGQQVAAVPPRQGRRDAWREAVAEPHPPAGQRPQCRIVADQPSRTQRPAEERQHSTAARTPTSAPSPGRKAACPTTQPEPASSPMVAAAEANPSRPYPARRP